MSLFPDGRKQIRKGPGGPEPVSLSKGRGGATSVRNIGQRCGQVQVSACGWCQLKPPEIPPAASVWPAARAPSRPIQCLRLLRFAVFPGSGMMLMAATDGDERAT